MKEKYIEGTREGKRAFVVFLIVIAAFVLLVYFLGSNTEAKDLGDLKAVLINHLPVLLTNTVFYIVLGWLIVKYSLSYLKHGFWPPPGLPVPFRTRVSYLKHPAIVKLFVLMVLLLFLLNIAINWYAWLSVYKQSQVI
ncbi:MAG: hypothetical protein AB2654_05105 [Candidatus Thiodiazotropha sp.]